jgi:hypothetical protein
MLLVSGSLDIFFFHFYLKQHLITSLPCFNADLSIEKSMEQEIMGLFCIAGSEPRNIYKCFERRER